MKDEEGYYSVPINDCLERISSCLGSRKIAKSCIQEYINDEEAWNSGLMTLLCEYYSINCRYVELMDDLILTPPFVDEVTEEESVSIDLKKYSLLASYSKLLLDDEMELKYAHKIYLFIQ